MQTDRRVVIVRENVYGVVLNEYSNGYETTAGLAPLDVQDVESPCITFDSEHATELPIDWNELLFLDDNNSRQHIKAVHFESIPAYEMQNDTWSYTVTL